MSGLADGRSQMPPQLPNGDRQHGSAADNILTSGAATGDAGGVRLAQASAAPAQATAGSAVPQLSPAGREQLFQQYMRNLAPREGGTVNPSKAQDPAGLTHKGISTEFLKSYRTQHPQENLPADPRQLTTKQREDISRAEFFDRARVAEVAAIPGVKQQAPKLPEQLFEFSISTWPRGCG